MSVVNDQIPEWKIEKTSEDWCDYNRQNYAYVQLELIDENFKRAPPVSIAQYKARTSDVLPPGIFDEYDVHGNRILRTEESHYNGGLSKGSIGLALQDYVQKQNVHYGFLNSKTVLSDTKSGVSLQLANKTNDVKEEPIKNNPSNKSDNQKKKKKKFKQFNFQDSSTQNSRWTQPWTPDFSKNFKNNDEFPAL